LKGLRIKELRVIFALLSADHNDVGRAEKRITAVTKLASVLIVVLAVMASACSGSTPTAPSDLVAAGKAAFTGTATPASEPTTPAPAPAPAPAPTPEPDPEPPVEPTIPVVEPPIPDSRSNPYVEYLDFVNLSCPTGMKRKRAGPGDSGAFWDDRRVTTRWNIKGSAAFPNSWEFMQDPEHEIAVAVGSKPGYVIASSSIDHVRLSTGKAWFMYTLYADGGYHQSITRTVHLTVMITRSLQYKASGGPDGSPELPLSDPRILAYKSVPCVIDWVD